MVLTKPRINCKVIATDEHPSRKEGEHLGIVHKVDGGMIVMKRKAGDIEIIGWKNNSGIRLEV